MFVFHFFMFYDGHALWCGDAGMLGAQISYLATLKYSWAATIRSEAELNCHILHVLRMLDPLLSPVNSHIIGRH